MKKQEHAALLLQTSWRRVYTAKTLRAKLLRQLEAEFSAYSIPIQSQVPVSDRLQPHHFLRYLIVIHNISQQVSFPVQDENSQWDLEESFIQLFWADISTKSDAIPTNQPFSIHIDRYLFGAAAVTSPHAPERNVWLYQTLFLIRVLFKHTLTPLQLPSKHAEAFLRHLLSSKSYSHYGDIVISKLLHRLSEPPNSIFAIVLAHLSTLHDTVFGEWIGELFVSALNLKCNEKAINEFVWHTIRTAGAMRHPLVMHSIAKIHRSESSIADIWAQSIRSIRSKCITSVQNTIGIQERAIYTGNLLDLALHFDGSEIIFEIFQILQHILTPSVVFWTFENALKGDYSFGMQAHESEDDEPFISTLQSFLQNFHSDMKTDSNFQENKLFSLVRLQCEQICSERLVHRAFESLVPTEHSHIHSVCNVYSIICIVLHSRQSFSTLVILNPPLPPMYGILNALSGHFQCQRNSIVKTLLDSMQSPLQSIAPLLVHNFIFSHLVMALDDETFYDHQWPLPLSDLLHLVDYLRDSLHQFFWNNDKRPHLSPSDTLIFFASMTTSITLFNQLYDRDCRRQRIPIDAWRWPSMPPIKDLIDLDSMEGKIETSDTLFDILYQKLIPTQSLPQSRVICFLLTTTPQIFSFSERVSLFQRLLELEKQTLATFRNDLSSALCVRVRRDTIVEDSYSFFQQIATLDTVHFKGRIKVTFVNEQGLEEAGIDGGGVFKEFMDVLTRAVFSPELGYFLMTEDKQHVYPNPAANVLTTRSELLHQFRFMGRVLGKAVYENILVEPQFAAFFLNKLLARYNYIDDLQSLDPVLYKSLMTLKKDATMPLEDLELSFTLLNNAFGRVETVELIPNGSEIAVTHANKIRYLHLLAHYKLNVASAAETNAFLRGFRDLIPAKWIQMFSPNELQMLIGGNMTKAIDLSDWKANTLYASGYHPTQTLIVWFWEILAEMTPNEQSRMLQFITSVSRPPLLGFRCLDPPLCIQQVRCDDDSRLPSSATCMNLLKLPTYSSKRIMKEKLLYAIQSNAGFDLS
ncbi:unnamed protein product [Albugo candida]|nr:unnamed protein product [Albugo candida]|eukprot:CCI45901.1 unnamed protein product [Albugo candida]